MATIYNWRTARKGRRCAGRAYDTCRRYINPGERYVMSVLTPGDGDVGNIGWWHSPLCNPCAGFYLGPPPDPKAATP